jgi:hypothetical protein
VKLGINEDEMMELIKNNKPHLSQNFGIGNGFKIIDEPVFHSDESSSDNYNRKLKVNFQKTIMKTTYILVERTPDGNGNRDSENEIAVSTDREALEKYCETTLHSKLGKKKNMWATYYEIKISKMVVLSDMKTFPTDSEIQKEVSGNWSPSDNMEYVSGYERGFESGCEFTREFVEYKKRED